MKILVQCDRLFETALALAARIQGMAVEDPAALEGEERYLRLGPDGLALVQGKMELKGDFMQMRRRVLGGRLQHEKLLRAVPRKDLPDDPLAVDATAGLGEDSFILAAAGYRVIMCEYNPVIAALLRDALLRAQNADQSTDSDPEVSQIREIASRMELREGNSIKIMSGLERRPDVIYLDPMFPAKTKSGISTKKLQLFQKLESPCEGEEVLFESAAAASPGRIVVKRPMRGSPLAGRRPDYSIPCRSIRYDCYVF